MWTVNATHLTLTAALSLGILLVRSRGGPRLIHPAADHPPCLVGPGQELGLGRRGHGGVKAARKALAYRAHELQIDGGAGPVSLRLDDLPDPLKPHVPS